jgi:hypothetical protein
MIAIVRARVDPTTQAYLQRKTAEGKTKKAALRSLKRALARRLYHHLTRPPLPAPNPTDHTPPQRTQPTTNTPSPMTCIT